MRAHSPHLLPQTSLSTLHPVPWLTSPRAGGSGLSVPVCELGEALGEEGGWEASGNWGWGECRQCAHLSPTMVTTLFVLSTLQSSIPCCLRPRHPELRPHPTIPTTVLCLRASPRSSSGHQGIEVPDGCSSRRGQFPSGLAAALPPSQLPPPALPSPTGSQLSSHTHSPNPLLLKGFSHWCFESLLFL